MPYKWITEHGNYLYLENVLFSKLCLLGCQKITQIFIRKRKIVRTEIGFSLKNGSHLNSKAHQLDFKGSRKVSKTSAFTLTEVFSSFCPKEIRTFLVLKNPVSSFSVAHNKAFVSSLSLAPMNYCLENYIVIILNSCLFF